MQSKNKTKYGKCKWFWLKLAFKNEAPCKKYSHHILSGIATFWWNADFHISTKTLMSILEILYITRMQTWMLYNFETVFFKTKVIELFDNSIL